MTHVVTENCSDCRFTDCAESCPVQCFHADEQRLYIDPNTCIDCGACVPLCPVQAIKESFDLTPEQERWIDINSQKSQLSPVITGKEIPLPTAESRKAALGF